MILRFCKNNYNNSVMIVIKIPGSFFGYVYSHAEKGALAPPPSSLALYPFYGPAKLRHTPWSARTAPFLFFPYLFYEPSKERSTPRTLPSLFLVRLPYPF